MRRTATPLFIRHFLLGLLLALGGLLASPRRGYAQSNQGVVPDSTELRVLRQFYYSTDGPHWYNRTGWPATDSAWAQATLPQASEWAGLTCVSGDVWRLSFGANNLTGTLPASMGALSVLYWLDIHDNHLLNPLPSSLLQLPHFGILHLTNDGLSGSLPSWLGQLPVLWNLNLNDNRFTGAIPPELGQLTTLQELELSSTYNTAQGNRFTGGLPKELGQLVNLRRLSIDLNPLGGPIPKEFGQLRKLEFLEIDESGLTGEVPIEVLNLPQLRQLVLGQPFNVYYHNPNRLTLPAPSQLVNPGRLGLELATCQFDFGDLEPYFVAPGQLLTSPNSNYAPQRRPLVTVDTLVVAGQGARFTARLRGKRTHYQWQRLVAGQWLDMPGDTLATKSWASLRPADAGSYRAQATNRLVTGLVLYSPTYALDVTPYPALARNLPVDGNGVPRLQSAPVATDANASQLVPDRNYVRVWTPRVALTEAATGPTRPPGIRREEWANVPNGGTPAIPLTTTPALVTQLPSLEATSTTRFNYGARLRAWLIPPVTGTYTLYLSATHAGKLYLSTTASPADTVRLATGAPFTTSIHNYTSVPQQARQVALVAGQAYYLEVQHQHQWGAGYVSVGWQLPGGPVPTQPINGQYLRPFVPGEGTPAAVTWSVDQAAMSTQYLDGLGRPLQTVQWQASPSKHDVVQVQQYDGLGREPRQYLPYVADSTSGGFRPRGLAEQGRYYSQLPATGPPSPTDLTQHVARTGVAFTETLFEASPLNRVLAQAAPGEVSQLTGGHHLERQERPNVFADSVLRFAPGYDPRDLDPHCQGSYAPGELWGSFTRDEHGFWSAEWKDKLGQVVGKQVQTLPPGRGPNAPRRWLRTLYAYDDFQHLRFVLPPEASRRLLAAVTAQAPPPPPTGVRLQRWDNAPGSTIASIPLAQPPTRTQVLAQLEEGSRGGDFHYGARLQAWLSPPQGGDYTFYLTGDEAAELWLSTDADPQHKVRLLSVSSQVEYTDSARQYTRYATQRSVPVPLRPDQVYYLEVLHKQEWDKGYASVSWRQPDGTPVGQPLAGRYLLPYDATQPAPAALGSQPLPPAALPASAQPYVFHYRYDGRGRQVAKQVPGQDGETVVVYDQLDRPVLSQDAQQRTRREWSWSKYDALGRVVLTGLTSRQDTLGQVSLQAQAAADTATVHQYEQRTASLGAYPHGLTTDQSFPRLGQQGFGAGQVLSVTYYDDYDFDNNGQADVSYDPSQDGQFAAGQAPVADAGRTTGLVTRTKTRVLGVAENDSQQAAWLSTTTFYDERARPVQVQSTNARQGTDLVTTQLDFTGQVRQSVTTHQGPHHAPVLVREQFRYDHAGRVLATRQQLPGEGRAALVDSMQYNELGQLTRKTLGEGRLRQDVDYAYNIRGWLTGLNNPVAPDPQDLFNLSLHYEAGFTPGYEQYNGNLTGQTWRGRDGVQRAQGYVYDPVNRLLQGDFVARTVGASPSAGAWTQELDHYRLSFVSYDDNGNIQTLRRQGLLQAATSRRAKVYGAVDNLSYAYQGNRLQSVDDLVSGNQLPRATGYNGAPTSLAGDFQEQGVQQAQEYGYDANGNLTQDKNKGIMGIGYNHLNLPRQLHFGQVGDSVVFRYTASGQKVAKLVYQTGKPTQRTDYLGPYQYEQDSLRFFPHAEGRVLRFVSGVSGAISYQREYTLKDHLGNLRLAYRAGQVRTLTATLEQDAATHQRESQQFDSVSVSPPVAVATMLTRSGRYAAQLNAGGSSPQPLGPLTQLGVQRGDTVTVQAYGYYAQPVQHGFLFSLASFVANLLHPASPPPPGLDAGRRKNLPLLQVGLSAGLASIPQLSGGVPQGYLRLLVFNRDSALVSQQVQQLTSAARGGYEPLRLQVVLPQDGYVTAYVGTESDVDVFFDDVQVEHRPGLQVQETQYDAAGLELAGLAPPSPGIKGLNNYRFNGKEFQADLGLNWNHQDWRLLDPTTLRWNGVDPELENGQESWSPYSFGYDNAVRFADADGRWPWPSMSDLKKSYQDITNHVSSAVQRKLNSLPIVKLDTSLSLGLQAGIDIDHAIGVEANLASVKLHQVGFSYDTKTKKLTSSAQTGASSRTKETDTKTGKSVTKLETLPVEVESLKLAASIGGSGFEGGMTQKIDGDFQSSSTNAKTYTKITKGFGLLTNTITTETSGTGLRTTTAEQGFSFSFKFLLGVDLNIKLQSNPIEQQLK